MKKNSKPKSSPVAKPAKPDVVSLLTKMQEQLAVLERQMNVIVSRLPERSSYIESRPQQQPQHTQQPQYVQQPPRNQLPQQQNDNRQNNNFRERTLYKIICADCHNECEIPFKPSNDRPVYCKACFAKRKQGGSFFKGNNPAPRVNNEPRTIYAPAVPPTPVAAKPEATNEARKSPGKKKATAKKRKK